ncbi:MAG: DNA cytosine methyltransferase, partial [Bacteroidota bacterium]
MAISINQAAEQLNLTPQQVRSLCRNEKLPAQKVGKTWILEQEDVSAYYAQSTCGVAEDQIPYTTRTRAKDTPIALSFFSGAMGMDIGIERAGFKTLFASEINNACRKTIRRNQPDIALVGDMRDYGAAGVRSLAGLSATDEIDLIVGGPPCQAFSTAGKRRAFTDERGNVFLNFIDLIIDLQPKYAVIENVRGLLSASLKHTPHSERAMEGYQSSIEEQPGGALIHILEKLEANGFGVSFNLYNAANFGTPQKRERVILICSRDGKKPPYLEPTHSETGAFELPYWRTFEEAIESLKGVDHQHINFPEKRLKYYRMIGPGQNWRSLPLEVQKEAMG